MADRLLKTNVSYSVCQSLLEVKKVEKYWNKEIECMPLEDMKKLQNERLVAQVKHVYENVPYYKKLMDEKGVTPDDIKSEIGRAHV